MPTTNKSVKSTKSGSNLNSISGLSNGTSGASTSDGALGQCALIDSSRAERAVCITCYAKVLSERCGSGSTPETCPDTAVAAAFTSLVNTCVTNAIMNGNTCYNTCPSGTTLNPTTCQCSASTPPSGSNGSSQGPTDSGQTDYGPPLATLVWPASTFDWQTNPLNQITRDMSVYFEIRNRGNSVPKLNVYSFQAIFPASTPYVTNLIAPTFQTSINRVQATFSVLSGTTTTDATADGIPDNNKGFLGEYVFFDDFERNLDVPAADFQTTRSGYFGYNNGNAPGGVLPRAFIPIFSRFLGFLSATPDLLYFEFSDLKPANYLLTFDLYLVNGWTGATGQHGIKISQIDEEGDESILFNKSFSTSFDHSQSYEGPYTSKDTAVISADPSTDAIFPLSFPISHYCSSNPVTNQCKLKLKIEATNITAGTQKWAIDNFGILPLREYAAKYTITDTNQLSSAYCMWFEIQTQCRNPVSVADGISSRTQCSATAAPKSGSMSGAAFSAVQATPSAICPVSEFPALPAAQVFTDFNNNWVSEVLLYGGKTNAACVAAGGTSTYFAATEKYYCKIAKAAASCTTVAPDIDMDGNYDVADGDGCTLWADAACPGGWATYTPAHVATSEYRACY